MKKSLIIYLIVGITLLASPTAAVLALSPFDPGGQYNPLYFKEVQDPALVQKRANDDKEQRLKSQYGISAYNDCYRQSGAAGKDTSDPSYYASVLSWIGHCLERQQIKTVVPPVNTPPVTTCPANAYIDPFWESLGSRQCKCIEGLTLEDGQCITLTAYCQKHYGAHSVVQKDQYKQNSCGCEVGYQLSLGGTILSVACVKSVSNTIIPSQPSNNDKPKVNPSQNKPASKPVGDGKVKVPAKPSTESKESAQMPPAERLSENEGVFIENPTGPAMSLLLKP
jgi:hypothetical protein